MTSKCFVSYSYMNSDVKFLPRNVGSMGLLEIHCIKRNGKGGDYVSNINIYWVKMVDFKKLLSLPSYHP